MQKLTPALLALLSMTNTTSTGKYLLNVRHRSNPSPHLNITQRRWLDCEGGEKRFFFLLYLNQLPLCSTLTYLLDVRHLSNPSSISTFSTSHDDDRSRHRRPEPTFACLLSHITSFSTSPISTCLHCRRSTVSTLKWVLGLFFFIYHTMCANVFLLYFRYFCCQYNNNDDHHDHHCSHLTSQQ